MFLLQELLVRGQEFYVAIIDAVASKSTKLQGQEVLKWSRYSYFRRSTPSK